MAPMASRRATSASWIGDSKGVGLSFIVSDDLDRKYSLGTASLGLLARNVLAGRPLDKGVGRHRHGCD